MKLTKESKKRSKVENDSQSSKLSDSFQEGRRKQLGVERQVLTDRVDYLEYAGSERRLEEKKLDLVKSDWKVSSGAGVCASG
ncbi:hypothetical protein DdX_09827 [Ditylenchus destructor]|uniref:Uncharacterized protein n=1 Tax=Ditylenchus destructor TaxID=166010 RepID=A0AAD4N1I3_9BILA|nr:hypothetical protein DdX_09827 [Ditylenchus destructor]